MIHILLQLLGLPDSFCYNSCRCPNPFPLHFQFTQMGPDSQHTWGSLARCLNCPGTYESSIPNAECRSGRKGLGERRVHGRAHRSHLHLISIAVAVSVAAGHPLATGAGELYFGQPPDMCGCHLGHLWTPHAPPENDESAASNGKNGKTLFSLYFLYLFALGKLKSWLGSSVQLESQLKIKKLPFDRKLWPKEND